MQNDQVLRFNKDIANMTATAVKYKFLKYFQITQIVKKKTCKMRHLKTCKYFSSKWMFLNVPTLTRKKETIWLLSSKLLPESKSHKNKAYAYGDCI